MSRLKIKKDRYYKKKKVAKVKIFDVLCAKCGQLVLIYQKDGIGYLKRCYFNRIIEPAKYKSFANRGFYPVRKKSSSNGVNDIGNLECECGQIIGAPAVHRDGRKAFRMIRGKFRRRINKKFNI